MRNFILAITFIFWICTITGLSAQKMTPPPGTPKKAIKAFNKAREIQKENTSKALELYEKAANWAPDFIAPRIFKASLLYRLKDLVGAQHEFKMVRESGIDYPPKVLLTSGIIDYKLNDFTTATNLLQQYLETNPKNKDLKSKAELYLSHSSFAKNAVVNPIPVELQRLSENVNTDYNEYAPSITADGKKLVFSRRVNGFELLFETLLVDGSWTPARSMDRINDVFEGGAHTLSADGRLLVFTSCNRKDGFGSCDLFYSRFRRGEWTSPRNMGRPVNSSAWDAQPALAENGRTLYFSSNRQGTLGAKDIWMSRRNEDGSWSHPVNLGPSINTKKDEKTPFMHFDNETLYFMSSGYPGMGDFDLYLSRKVKDTLWSPPKNLGYPLNTKFQEGTLVVGLDGNKSFLTSDRHHHEKITKGDRINSETDIYELNLPSEIAPKPSTFAEFIVLDGTTQKSLKAKLIIKNKSGKVIWSGQTQADGYQLVCLHLGDDYSFQVHHPDYTFYSERLKLDKIFDAVEPARFEIALERPEEVETNTAIVLKNVLFETGSDALVAEATDELQFIANWLSEHANVKIAIHGHTDNVGQPSDNLQLSKKRAASVVRKLSELGVQNQRMISEGFGESQPIADNESEEGRQQNRRTEMIVLVDQK